MQYTSRPRVIGNEPQVYLLILWEFFFFFWGGGGIYTMNYKLVSRSHARATQGNFREMEWDVATSWQLRSCVAIRCLYVAVTGSTWLLRSLRGAFGKVVTYTPRNSYIRTSGNCHVCQVTATRNPHSTPFREYRF